MNNPSTIQQLREMKFSAMASELELQLRDPASYAQLSFDDRFGLLVNAEWNRRQANKLAIRIREARMDIPSATLEGIEYYEDRGLDRTEMARYASCGYIEEEHHIILKARPAAARLISPVCWATPHAESSSRYATSGCRSFWMS